MDYQITDFRLAGYLALHGAVLLRTQIGSKPDEVVFVFASQTKEQEDLQHWILQYPTSLECRYDASCRAMMDVVRIFKLRGR